LRPLIIAALTFPIMLGAGVPVASAQQKADVPKRIDAAEIRRQAAQRAELRALLADPDADIRLMTMRAAILNGDQAEREAAVAAGLASNETAMLEQAIRGIMKSTQTIVIQFVDGDGKPVAPDSNGAGGQGTDTIRMTVTKFDPTTGQVEGRLSCIGNNTFQGQFQGAIFAFRQDFCSGSLVWSPDTADFRGRVTVTSTNTKNVIVTGIWRPL